MGKESIWGILEVSVCCRDQDLAGAEAGCVMGGSAVGGCDDRKLVGSVEVVMSLPGACSVGPVKVEMLFGLQWW